MTLPDERYTSLKQLEARLIKIAMQSGQINKRELRGDIMRALRHFPTGFEIDKLAEESPHLLKKA